MNRIGRIVTSAGMALMMATVAHADVTMNSVRVGAVNTVALATFYQSAFGMQEVKPHRDPRWA
jgi:hypothetical protein